MKTFDQKTVTERFARLPDGVKDIILSDVTTESIRALTEVAGLGEKDKKVCIEQITLASTGLSTTKDFKVFVTSELPIDPQKATALFEGVVQHIFNPVREALLLSLGTVADTNKPSANALPNEGVQGGLDPYRAQVQE
ncbi:TPA: hypothetical protein DEP58_00555 [Patescibacteria group bacterium]|nr:MAG: hypothetical protein UU98_C0002G0018 [Parcubacteria group bacterium GW2011_GWD2_42_14]HCC04779.1 hypothetical protein [Patescibacteria group bacterium]